MTEHEKIKQMSIEEMARFLLSMQEIYESEYPYTFHKFMEYKIKWLESEVEE